MKKFDPMELLVSFVVAVMVTTTLVLSVMLFGLLCAVFPFALPILGFAFIWRLVYVYYTEIK